MLLKFGGARTRCLRPASKPFLSCLLCRPHVGRWPHALHVMLSGILTASHHRWHMAKACCVLQTHRAARVQRKGQTTRLQMHRLLVILPYCHELWQSGFFAAAVSRCEQLNASSKSGCHCRWRQGELLTFSSSAFHQAELGLCTPSMSDHQNIVWLSRINLPAVE